MIKIKLSDQKIKDLQEKHWNWFYIKSFPKLKKAYLDLSIKQEVYYTYKTEKKLTKLPNRLHKALNNFFELIFSTQKISSKEDLESVFNNHPKPLLYNLIVGSPKEHKKILRKLESQLFYRELQKELSIKRPKKTQTHLINVFKYFFDYEGDLPKEFSFSRKDFSSSSDVDIISTIKEIKETFSYNKYSKHFPNTWSKYHIAYELDITTCPYCNRSYIHPYYYEENIKKGKKNTAKTRGDLDHFLPKSKYPFLAVSLFNLVPCCKVCNSSFKGDKEMSYDTHLNPYDTGIEDIVVFNTKTIDSDVYRGISEEYEIIYKPITGANTTDYEKAKGNLEIFKIKELYIFHKDYIKELIAKANIYTEEYVDELWNEYNGTLFDSRSEVVQMIISNYIDDTDLDKRILAKLTKDISQELGLLDL